MSDELNQLWVNLSGLGDGNIFAVYHQILATMFEEEGSLSSDSGISSKEQILLPSDNTWKMKIYYQLVDKQRELQMNPSSKNEDTESVIKVPVRVYSSLEATTEHLLQHSQCQLKSDISLASGKNISDVTWSAGDLVKAGCLLAVNPVKVTFTDEQEMRRVYSLVYDVLRYKSVLSEALADISFFYLNPKLEKETARVWLLLYDLYHRKFQERKYVDLDFCKKKFVLTGLNAIEDALWKMRIRIAASISRLRIKNSARRLNDLLPEHLQDDKVGQSSKYSPVAGWMNTFKIKNPALIENGLHKIGLTPFKDHDECLGQYHYRWDPVCPHYIMCHPLQRTQIAQSILVRDKSIILQDKSFCLGPAIFANLLISMELTGTIIQTHVNSPRSTAYLCALLTKNNKIAYVHAFGAGDRKEEFEKYMDEVGVTNVIIYRERLIDTLPNKELFENVTAVFATPPNSYSAIKDPIDLICSRGGDLSMLKVLTESTIGDAGKKRVHTILEEQRLTLRYAMSRPQIQFVLYETHSSVAAENDLMVSRVITEMNTIAHERHIEIRKTMFHAPISINPNPTEIVPAENEETNNNEENDEKEVKEIIRTTSAESIKSKYTEIESQNQSESLISSIFGVDIPPCDLFEVGELPDLCTNSDQCLSPKDEGCFLSLIRRKEITHFDARYMIQMAESRGLFGDSGTGAARKTCSKLNRPRKREERVSFDSFAKTRRKCKIEFARIAAPTHASLIRRASFKRLNGDTETTHTCSRHRPARIHIYQIPRARRWWSETTHHIFILRQLLSLKNNNNDTIAPLKNKNQTNECASKPYDIVRKTSKADKNVLLSLTYTKPFLNGFPRLKLSRSATKLKRTSVPVHIKLIIFSSFNNNIP